MLPSQQDGAKLRYGPSYKDRKLANEGQCFDDFRMAGAERNKLFRRRSGASLFRVCRNCSSKPELGGIRGYHRLEGNHLDALVLACSLGGVGYIAHREALRKAPRRGGRVV
jgi:hypothetical protein